MMRDGCTHESYNPRHMLMSVAAAALLAGMMIGLTGIGGVLVVPALTELAGIRLERAIGTSMLCFFCAGVFAAAAHLRRVRLDAPRLLALALAAALGALAGSASLDWLPGRAVRLFIALLALASGLHVLLRRQAAVGQSIPSARVLAPLGLVVGYGSAISGTGGPVLLVPLLLALGTPATAAVALGLAAQLPITLTASIVNAFAGRIDLILGAALGAVLTVGALAGAWLSGRLSARAVSLAVGLALVAVGLWYGYASLAGNAGRAGWSTES
jgi:uncharacterized membrane protein YfcA